MKQNEKNKQSKLLKAGVVKAVTIESETWPAMFDIWRKCVAGEKTSALTPVVGTSGRPG